MLVCLIIVISDNNVNTDDLARKFALNFINLADNKTVVNDFCSFF